MTKLAIIASVFGASVLGLALAAPAQAKVVKVVHEGMVEFGDGDAQLFGAPNNSLTGMHVQSIYTFDLNRGDRFDGVDSAYVQGGSNLGVVGPLLSSSVRINGVTLGLNGGLENRYSASDQLRMHTETAWPAGGVITVDNAAAIDFQGLDFEYGGGFSGVSDWLVYSGGPQQAQIQWVTMTYTVTEVPSAIPEPASWALMIAGFGLTGAALRGSRRAYA
ncbi:MULTISPECIES: PEPxxWA-CTERM sorting domain-containing protein [Phenylobacterium]|uniref:Ice-binding protein C-terminal domain-containing protein n=1 Tax=Phenylobacterium koreense TaxID=266125 RepID=A0ABV2ED33_9CAUL